MFFLCFLKADINLKIADMKSKQKRDPGNSGF